MAGRPDPDLARSIAAAKATLAASTARRSAQRREDPADWAERIAGYPLDPWQADVMRADPSDQIVMVTSRQVGKSSTVALKAARIVADGGRVIVVSPTQRQSGLLFRQLHDHLMAAGVALERETAMFGDVPGDEREATAALHEEDTRMDRIARAAASAARRGRRIAFTG
jgi:hypothetical protein